MRGLIRVMGCLFYVVFGGVDLGMELLSRMGPRGHIVAIGVLYIIFAGVVASVGILIMVGSARAPAALEKLATQQGEFYATSEARDTTTVTEGGVRVTGPGGEEVKVGVTDPEAEQVKVWREQVEWFAGLGRGFGGAIVTSGGLGVITGIGLLMLASWGRILGIIIGILWLPWFPIGTAIGIYALVILFNAETVGLFAGGAPPQAPPQVPPQVPPQTPPPPPPTAEQ